MSEAYIDDVVVKSKTADTLIADLTETFKALKVYRWKLNPTKCIFGVPSGILLFNIVSRRGIKANLEKRQNPASLHRGDPPGGQYGHRCRA